MLSQAPAPVQWLMTKLFEHLNKFVSINYDVQDERYSKFNISSSFTWSGVCSHRVTRLIAPASEKTRASGIYHCGSRLKSGLPQQLQLAPSPPKFFCAKFNALE